MKTLVYKRTHTGDPDHSGLFGIYDCMGRVRGWDFEAVIGVGVKSPDSGYESIAGKLTWIGIGAHKVAGAFPAPYVTFDWFRLWDETGPNFQAFAPKLFRHMFVDQHVRSLLSQNLDDELMRREVQRILSWARDTKHKSAVAMVMSRRAGKCAC